MRYPKPVLKHSFDKSAFKNARCLLTISVGQEVHEGDKFCSTIDLINESFGACILLVDDSLQRHSMALDKKEEAEFFYPQSIVEGDLWLERNQVHYQRLQNLERILRWDYWLKHPKYLNQQQTILSSIIGEPGYQQGFNQTIDGFLQRFYPRLLEKESFDLERAKKLCLDYLVEECTALCLWTELKCHYEVYPSKRNLVMTETHQRFVLPTYPDFLHPISIKFKNRKQLKPQQFQAIGA